MLYLHVTCEISSFVKDVFVHLFRFSSVSALRFSSFHFLSESMELLFPACTTFYPLSLHRTRSPPLAKQTSEIEQIPFLFHSVQLMLRSHSARRSHGNLIRNRADHPPCIQGVTDVTELTYWSGSNVAPTSLSILCANRANRATAGSRVPRMKNSTQMAASPRARANLEQTHPPYPPINPISSLFFPLIWTNKVISFIFILFSHTVAQSVEFTLWCICVPE